MRLIDKRIDSTPRTGDGVISAENGYLSSFGCHPTDGVVAIDDPAHPRPEEFAEIQKLCEELGSEYFARPFVANMLKN